MKGLEPPTYGLQIRSSTIELHQQGNIYTKKILNKKTINQLCLVNTTKFISNSQDNLKIFFISLFTKIL